MRDSLVDNISIDFFRNFWFIFNFVSTEMTVETETYVYPLMSFVSEFGGGLGLFLGFSCLFFYDGFTFLFSKLKKYTEP